MKTNNDRINSVIKTAKNTGYSNIFYAERGYDFVEIICRHGSDTVTLRFYDNGMITER